VDRGLLSGVASCWRLGLIHVGRGAGTRRLAVARYAGVATDHGLIDGRLRGWDAGWSSAAGRCAGVSASIRTADWTSLAERLGLGWIGRRQRESTASGLWFLSGQPVTPGGTGRMLPRPLRAAAAHIVAWPPPGHCRPFVVDAALHRISHDREPRCGGLRGDQRAWALGGVANLSGVCLNTSLAAAAIPSARKRGVDLEGEEAWAGRSALDSHAGSPAPHQALDVAPQLLLGRGRFRPFRLNSETMQHAPRWMANSGGLRLALRSWPWQGLCCGAPPRARALVPTPFFAQFKGLELVV